MRVRTKRVRSEGELRGRDDPLNVRHVSAC